MRYNEQINLKLYTYTNNAFTLQAIIDDYQEISFAHNLYEAGDFTITINYNIPNALKFERGMFIQFGNDPYMFGEILTISDSIGEDGKGSQQRTITGKDARYIFKRRVIKNLNNEENWAMTDKGEICLRELVKAQCGSSAEAKRQLPVANTIPSSAEALGKEYSVAEAFSNLYDTLVTIATQSEIGWRIKFEGTLTLEVFEGADLSSQVQFSTDYDSLANGEFTDSAESYANTVYVAGKGTGADRDIYEGEQEIQGASPSGLDRYEAYDNQSSMTSESEYEAEALAMLTQYGQTINVSGQGLAKCPYEFQKQYNIGDTITLAFSGKSAKAQILSVVEHWVFGQYGIEFSFGKPINDFDRQMQLILKQIQKASNKTTTTSSVKWFTIPTDTTQAKADVIYDTIGFQGDVGSGGATFQLYWDSEKTGAKTYHIWFKQLAGTGKLTLTTGVSGASNLVMNAGTYVAIIYVDAEGNVTSQGATPTTTISSGNTQPATSGAVYDAIQQVTPATVDTAMSDTSTNAVQNKVIKEYVDTAETNAKNLANATGTLAVAHGGTGQTSPIILPTDAVLHYSFDELPDYPDGTAIYFRDRNFTNADGWVGGSNTFTYPNGIVTVANVITREVYKSGLSGSVVKATIRSSVDATIYLFASDGGGDTRFASVLAKANTPTEIIGSYNVTNIVGFSNQVSGSKFEILSFYIGDGSYSTPVIDNANGQNNGTNNGGIATQGMSGKGAFFPSATQEVRIPVTNLPAPTSNDNFTISCWVKVSTDYVNDTTTARKTIVNIGEYSGTFGIIRIQDSIGFICRDSSAERFVSTSMKKGSWHNYVGVYNGTTHRLSFYEDGTLIGVTTANISDYQFGSGASNWIVWSNKVVSGNASTTTNQPATIDDILIFNRALSDTEVFALYQNKANTPKYYNLNSYKRIKSAYYKVEFENTPIQPNDYRGFAFSNFGFDSTKWRNIISAFIYNSSGGGSNGLIASVNGNSGVYLYNTLSTVKNTGYIEIQLTWYDN